MEKLADALSSQEMRNISHNEIFILFYIVSKMNRVGNSTNGIQSFAAGGLDVYQRIKFSLS